MHVDELDYDLPESLIAQSPIEPRDAARLLVDRGPGSLPLDSRVHDLPTLLRPDDLIVLNETRVLPARIAITRSSGGRGEVLLVDDRGDGSWEALCRPSRKLAVGAVVDSARGSLRFRMGEDLGDGLRVVYPLHDGPLLDALEESGEAPLPPYIHERLDDAERYQTVFSQRAASSAAPTAGLHLTPSLLDTLRSQGNEICTVELVVGLDTFRPLSTERVEDHEIHTERYDVPAGTWDAVTRAKAEGRRVVAVGTTAVRALESMAATGEPSGRTDLFITPGYDFAVVDVLMTNFHLPRTSLLALVQAFVGARWRELYGEAMARQYRFLSFGDALLLERAELERAELERAELERAAPER